MAMVVAHVNTNTHTHTPYNAQCAIAKQVDEKTILDSIQKQNRRRKKITRIDQDDLKVFLLKLYRFWME